MLKVGLFGTCGNSTWRESFIKTYQEMGIDYFNPQVDDWSPECADIEAKHLAEDTVILFPVLSETYGLTSLGEVGFSILNAINLNKNRRFIIYIEDKVDASLRDGSSENEKLSKESDRLRSTIKGHLHQLDLDNVKIADSLDEMLEASIIAYEISKLEEKLNKFTPKNKRKTA